MTQQRLRWAELGGYVIALAGLVAVVSALTAPSPQPTALTLVGAAVMGLGLAPVTLGFYELGGRTPLLPARLALAVAIVTVIVWSTLDFAWAAGLMAFDESGSATGAFAVVAGSTAVIGAWLVGASLLAGSWLPRLPRGLGVVCGVGWLLAGVGLLAQDVGLISDTGGLVYQLLTPVWGLLMGRRFAAIRGKLRR